MYSGFLLIVAIVCSGGAGIAGILFNHAALSGVLALVPGLAALLENSLHLRQGANIHYRWRYSLETLRDQLIAGAPLMDVVKEKDKLTQRFHSMMEEKAGLDWKLIHPQRRKQDQ